MFRRSPKSPKSPSPLRHQQEELIRREAELRGRVEELERMIADVSRGTHGGPRTAREDVRTETASIDKRLQVSIALDDRYVDETANRRQPRALRKQRREGRWIFLLLLAALAAAVIFLMTHLPF